jgi:hypothetical protein
LDEINQFNNSEQMKNFSTSNKNYVKINNASFSNNNSIMKLSQNKKQK